jgi:glyoxylase-like metal-dependent hydrolase (beta-lactamase superfamily II)
MQHKQVSDCYYRYNSSCHLVPPLYLQYERDHTNHMANPRVPPPVLIPASQNTVEVSIVNTTSYMKGFPASTFVEPDVPGFDFMDVGSYSFVVKHPGSGSKYNTLLFDLGVRKDWENLPATFVEGIKAGGYGISVEKDVATILRENGQDLNEVGAIIWSHWHFDHTGDPQTFPTTTDLIVGPGFKQHCIPAYPSDKDSQLDERAWQDRKLHEIDFASDKGLRIGRFQAYDFYGDGSFYLLDSPGHAVGHISALARTTADPPSFLLLGGDIAHHCGEFRPSPYTPLPDMITPSPLSHAGPACPGKIFAAIHPKQSREEPFFDPVRTGGWHFAADEAKESIDKLVEADAYDNIFPAMAHDCSLAGIVDLYPKTANAWMEKGWKEKSRWGFLSSFAAKVEEDVPSTSDGSQNERAKGTESRKDSRASGMMLG